MRRMVRRVVHRTLGRPPSMQAARGRPLVTEEDLKDLPRGAEFSLPEGALITPLARQIAMDRGIVLVEPGTQTQTPNPGASAAPQSQTVALGADHAGYSLKEHLKGVLSSKGYQVIDCGTDGSSSVDYPDYALAVAELVAQGRAWRGIMVDGAGIGSCMTANKVPGVRAAMCYDLATAVNSREHNDANLLTLGAGMIGEGLARQIVQAWLETGFGGDRHARRVSKITQVEQRFSR